MQPVTPSTTTGMGSSRASLLLLLPGGLLLHLPGDGLGQGLLDRHPRRLAASRVHPGLRSVLELLRPLRRHRDEPELAVDVLGQDELLRLLHVSFVSFWNVMSTVRALSCIRLVRQRAARITLLRLSTQVSRSSFTIA